MHIRLLGFRFTTDATSLSLQTFADYINSTRGDVHKLGTHNRLMFINSTHNNEYYVGLLVTIKDQKTYCELVSNGNKLTIKVNELDAESNLMDFNFFVMNKANGLGLYQYYHQSCSLNSFGYFNSRRFSEHKKAEIDGEIAKVDESKLTEAQETAIRSRFKGQLKWEILVRKENLTTLIKEFNQVKAFEYSFLSLTTEEPEFKPLSNYVRKESTRIAFRSGSIVSQIAEGISEFVSRSDIDSGKVTGVDADGITRVLRITDNPDNFGEYSYDEIAPKINSMDIDSFEKSWIVQELLTKCSEYKHIFETRIK